MTRTEIVCRCLILAVVAAGAVHAGPAERPDARTAWLVPPGLQLFHESTKWRDGEIEYRGRSVVEHGEPVELDARELHPQHLEFTLVMADGRATGSRVTAYYSVADSLVCSVGIRVDDEPVEFEEQPYVDLRGPLTPGARWRYRTRMYPRDVDGSAELTWTVETEVVADATEATVPAGTFEGCLHTLERARTSDVATLRGGANVGRRVRLESTTDRWWYPGLNAVRETSTERTIAADASGDVLAEHRYRSELVRVEERR